MNITKRGYTTVVSFILILLVSLLAYNLFNNNHSSNNNLSAVSGSGLPPSIIQSCTDGHYVDANSSCTLSNLGTGNTLVAIGYSSGSGKTLSISGCNLSWTSVYSYNTSNYSWNIWTAQSNGGSCSPTVSLSPNDNGNFLNLMEVSNIESLDVTPANHHGGCTTNCTNGSINTITNGDLVLLSGFVPSGKFTYSNFTNGFSIFQQKAFDIEHGGSVSNVLAYLNQTSAGSISTNYDLSGYTSYADSIIMAFKPSSGGTLTNGQCSSTLNQCTTGTFQDVTDTSTQYLWQCLGSNGGTTASCSQNIPTTPVNGTCGPAAKTYTSTETFPSGAYCSSGTPSPSSPSNPSQGGSTTWSCLGSNGGTTVNNCTATRQAQTADTEAPTTPTNLSATTVSSSQINLSWTASTDNTAVTGYKIYRNGSQITTTTNTSYSNTGLSPSTSYTYTVSAYDQAGNNSSQSTSASATTQAPPPQGTYPWSNILSPERAIDWSQAGIPGGIPNRTNICANVSTTDTTSQIQAKINNCPQDGVVKFPAGTWTVSGLYSSNKGVVLRGEGPTKTTINLNGGNIYLGINGTGGQGGYPPGPYNAVNWTGGLNKGDTVLTVSSTVGMKVGQTVILDQLNDTNLVFPTGSEGTQSGGRNLNGDGFNTPSTNRLQFQMAEITAVNDSTHITINIPVDHTYNPALSPQVFWWSSNNSPYPGNMRHAGVEDLKVNANGQSRAIIFTWCSECWAKNVEVDNIARGAITTFFGFRNEIRDSYISQPGGGSGPTQYGYEIIESPYTKLENNIAFNVTAPVMPMTSDGLVVGYNYAQHIYAESDGWTNQFSAFEPHQAHNYNHLYEGNVTYAVGVDNVWGSSSQLTLFRNRISGFAPNKNNFRTPVSISAHQRYINLVGNILGDLTLHNRYQVDDVSSGGGDNFIYQIGFWNRWDYGQTPYDYVTKSSLMRWGNWDSATYIANGNKNGTRWCTGSGIGNPSCTVSEIANTEPVFPGLSNPSTTFPASFYLSSRPSWFGSVQWPAIGPDVTCVGSNCNSGTENHAAKIPAQLCYENGAKDANGYLTAFDADDCYYSGTTPPPTKTGDFNNDGVVNSIDYAILIQNWNTSSPTHDLNNDGIVNSIDYVILVQNWG